MKKHKYSCSKMHQFSHINKKRGVNLFLQNTVILNVLSKRWAWLRWERPIKNKDLSRAG